MWSLWKIDAVRESNQGVSKWAWGCVFLYEGQGRKGKTESKESDTKGKRRCSEQYFGVLASLSHGEIVHLSKWLLEKEEDPS